MLGADAWISDVFYGAALVVAVTLSTLLRRRRS
jgi:ribose transport system permease protein